MPQDDDKPSHSPAVAALHRKLVDVVIADESSCDPNVVLSALSHAVLDAAHAANCPLKVVLLNMVAMEAEYQAREAASAPGSAPEADPLIKPHDC